MKEPLLEEMGVEEEAMPPHWADGCYATRVAREKLHASFPSRTDRVLAVAFAALALAFLVYQVVQAGSRLSRARSQPTILTSSRLEPSLRPVLVMCTEFASSKGAFFVVMNGDAPNEGGRTEYQKPFIQISGDVRVNDVVGDGNNYTTMQFFDKLWTVQMATQRPGQNATELLEQWGYEDVTGDRLNDLVYGENNVTYNHRCAVFNADGAFRLHEPEGSLLTFTAITFSEVGLGGASTVFQYQEPINMFALLERPATRQHAYADAQPFVMSRHGVYQATVQALEYEFVNGSTLQGYDTSGAYTGKFAGEGNDLGKLFGVNPNLTRTEVSSLTVRARTYRVDLTREVPSYSLSQFASDVGGSLGVLTALYAFVFPTIVSLPHQLRGSSSCAPSTKNA